MNPRQVMGQIHAELFGDREHSCPRCGQINGKVGNNNHICCWSCQRHYCYICVKMVRRSSQHFGPKGCKQHTVGQHIIFSNNKLVIIIYCLCFLKILSVNFSYVLHKSLSLFFYTDFDKKKKVYTIFLIIKIKHICECKCNIVWVQLFVKSCFDFLTC